MDLLASQYHHLSLACRKFLSFHPSHWCKSLTHWTEPSLSRVWSCQQLLTDCRALFEFHQVSPKLVPKAWRYLLLQEMDSLSSLQASFRLRKLRKLWMASLEGLSLWVRVLGSSSSHQWVSNFSSILQDRTDWDLEISMLAFFGLWLGSWLEISN